MVESNFTSDAIILGTPTASATADAIILATTSASFDADARIMPSFVADAIVLSTPGASFFVDARFRVPILFGNVGPITAGVTALHVIADEVDVVDELTDLPIRYYFSAEHASHDAARSPVFSGVGVWEGWVPPTDGAWTMHVRDDSDDSSVDTKAFTVDA